MDHEVVELGTGVGVRACRVQPHSQRHCGVGPGLPGEWSKVQALITENQSGQNHLDQLVEIYVISIHHSTSSVDSKYTSVVRADNAITESMRASFHPSCTSPQPSRTSPYILRGYRV